MKYLDLDMRTKAAVIRAAVLNGITNLGDIEELWNFFDGGGTKETTKLPENSYYIINEDTFTSEKRLPRLLEAKRAADYISSYFSSDAYRDRATKINKEASSTPLIKREWPSMKEWSDETMGNLYDLNNPILLGTKIKLIPNWFSLKASEADPLENKIYAETIPDDGWDAGSFLAHEVGHFLPGYNTRMSKEYVNSLYKKTGWWYPEEELYWSNFYLNDYTKIPTWIKETLNPKEEIYNIHDREISENYSDLVALRYLLHRNGIFDSTDKNAKFSKEMLNLFRDTNDGKNNRFIKSHSDELIIKALNDIAYKAPTKLNTSHYTSLGGHIFDGTSEPTLLLWTEWMNEKIPGDTRPYITQIIDTNLVHLAGNIGNNRDILIAHNPLILYRYYTGNIDDFYKDNNNLWSYEKREGVEPISSRRVNVYSYDQNTLNNNRQSGTGANKLIRHWETLYLYPAPDPTTFTQTRLVNQLTPFLQAFANARNNGESSFTFNGLTFNTDLGTLADRVNSITELRTGTTSIEGNTTYTPWIKVASTGGPIYPFSFVKGVLPEVRYENGGQELIDRINATSSANFVGRLKDSKREYIENPDGSISTHKLGYSTENNKAIVFPTIQEIDGLLIDFSNLDWRDALNSAIQHKDTLQMTPELAAWFTTHYKLYYPAFNK